MGGKNLSPLHHTYSIQMLVVYLGGVSLLLAAGPGARVVGGLVAGTEGHPVLVSHQLKDQH